MSCLRLLATELHRGRLHLDGLRGAFAFELSSTDGGGGIKAERHEQINLQAVIDTFSAFVFPADQPGDRLVALRSIERRFGGYAVLMDDADHRGEVVKVLQIDQRPLELLSEPQGALKEIVSPPPTVGSPFRACDVKGGTEALPGGKLRRLRLSLDPWMGSGKRGGSGR